MRRPLRAVISATAFTMLLAGCGGAGDPDSATETAQARSERASAVATPTMTQFNAVRLANQATFGPTEELIAKMRSMGAANWVAEQMTLDVSRYTSGGDSSIHKMVSGKPLCMDPVPGVVDCWRDLYSADPLIWDFYKNAIRQPDQLRQRVAMALQQILVVSNAKIYGTYALREYHNMLLASAFGNYRDLLRNIIRSPVMGKYLDNVNNDPEQPNENFARELLQLFSIGTCRLHLNGNRAGERCRPNYDNQVVREYAFALTGWTYPVGGSSAQGVCWPPTTNCEFYDGWMVPAPGMRNTGARTLLSGVTVPAGAGATVAMNRVLDSLMAHDSMAPFVSRQLIQHLVASNPRPEYVKRVATAFLNGRFSAEGRTFGTGQRGDMAATVAAVLLDPDARGARVSPDHNGKLREPALLFTGVLRALNGATDGDDLGHWWGVKLRQYMFNSPSVFNFYPPDFPVASAGVQGPQFAIHNTDTALNRLNFVTTLIEWGGDDPDETVPGAIGTRIDLRKFRPDAEEAGRLVNRLSLLALGETLPPAERTAVVNAVRVWDWYNMGPGEDWREARITAAALLIFSSPAYQIIR